jgi:hypothetical protein
MWYMIVIMTLAGQQVEMPKVGGFKTLNECTDVMQAFVRNPESSELSITDISCKMN